MLIWISHLQLISAGPPTIIFACVAVAALAFALPNALMTAELATTFPDDGGQVAWVHYAYGRTISWHNAFYVWLCNLIDAAVYPQLMARYLRTALKLGPWGTQAVSLGVVCTACAMNLVGIDFVSTSQTIIFAVSLTPCLIFTALGLSKIDASAMLSGEGVTDWALVLSWTLWLYSGFSSLGTMAGEVRA